MSAMNNTEKSCLLLGMVYSNEHRSKRGQEYRDRVRCAALESLGYDVKTLDNKHDDQQLTKHCSANFSDTRRMMTALNKWKDVKYDHIILDYFFSPLGWARERWTDPLFTKTLPTLATSGLLLQGCSIWLPHLQCIEESLTDFYDYLIPYYTITKERDPKLNPLYLATEGVEDALLLCPDALTNDTQLRPLLDYSDYPFYRLELRNPREAAPAPTVVTPTSNQKKRQYRTSSRLHVDDASAPSANGHRGKRTKGKSASMLMLDSPVEQTNFLQLL